MYVAFLSWFESYLEKVLVGLETIGIREAPIVKGSISLTTEKFNI